MASRSGDSVDLLAAGLGPRPVKDPFAPEVSDDAILVQAAQAGDRAAFGRLYERYARMVHGVLLAKVPASAVDDLLQDVFLRALRRLSTLRESGSFGAWLVTITRNLANDYHRRSLPEEPLADDVPGTDLRENALPENVLGRRDHRAEHSSSKYGTAEQAASAAAILDAIRSLPDAYRETLILRLVEGLTGPEIAARTGLTHGSVRVNLHRGMEQLRAKLSPPASGGQPEQEML
jgi:RNA polymerase sigma-70 factor, ECF subfamily